MEDAGVPSPRVPGGWNTGGWDGVGVSTALLHSWNCMRDTQTVERLVWRDTWVLLKEIADAALPRKVEVRFLCSSLSVG